MNKTEWLNSRVKDPQGTKDYYTLYDDFCNDFCKEYDTEPSFESYKRYTRTAFAEYKGTDKGTKESQTTEKADGSIEFKLKSYSFQSEEDLFKAGKFDPEIWKCDKFRMRITQNANNPYLITEGTFEKKIKDTSFPVIESANIVIDSYVNTFSEPTDCVVNLSDLHSPMQDDMALDVAIQIIKELYPKIIVVNGDSLDLTDFSNKFLASIECRQQTQIAINSVAAFLGRLRSICPKSRIVLMEGNHGARMQKAILQNMSAAIGLKRADDLDGYDALSIPNLLGIDKMNIEYQPYPDGELWLTDNLRFHHGEKLNVGKITDENMHCEVMGHGHRIEIVSRSKKVRDGQKEIYTAMFGCMCKVDGSVPSVSSFSNWQQGFGVIYFNKEMSQPVPIYIHEGTAIFNGKLYKSKKVC